MLTQKEIQLLWPKIKIGVLRHWNKLIPNEVQMTEGRINSLLMLVQDKYGKDADFYPEFEDICKNCVANGPSIKPMTSEKSQKLDINKQKIDGRDPEILKKTIPEIFKKKKRLY